MGIIYTGKDNLTLRELTSQRSVAALPVAARYRIVDFLLSSMVNSGIRNVGIITQKNYHSLMDHLGSGKEWDLHTRNNGLFILPPFLTQENGGEYRGPLDALRYNFDYLRRSKQELVVLTNSNSVFNTNFQDLIEYHEKSGADITLMYGRAGAATKDFGSSRSYQHTYVDVDETGTVVDMEINPNAASYDRVSMDVIVIKRTLLIHLADRAYAQGHTDLNRDLLRGIVKSGELVVKGYEFTGYWRRIETIKGYFNFSMDLLDGSVRKELFGAYPVYTKTRDDVPALYLDGAQVKNSLIADGCVISGTVENSIIFRGVRVRKGAVVRNCIIMQDSDIEDNVELENVILDKAVTVRSNGRLIGEKQYPIVIGKNVTL